MQPRHVDAEVGEGPLAGLGDSVPVGAGRQPVTFQHRVVYRDAGPTGQVVVTRYARTRGARRPATGAASGLGAAG